MAAPQLPPGWTAQWDESAGRHVFVETATGRTTWQPPPPPPGPRSNRMSMPPLPPPHAAGGPGAAPTSPPPPRSLTPNPQGAPSGGTAPGIPTSPPPPVGAPGRSTKRHYPTAELAASTYNAPPAYDQYGGAQAGYDQGQYFTPGATDRDRPGTAPGPPPVFSPAGAPPNGPPPVYPSQPGGVAGLTSQFGGMSVGGAQQMGHKMNPLHTVNIAGQQPNIMDLSKPPPDIILPPNACISTHPKANADPSYQRSTLNAIPTTSSLLNKSKIPLALILSPMRSTRESDGDEEVPLVTDCVIARCRRCRTYINPYVTFIDGGNRWKCCMCNISNEVPQLFDWDQEQNQPANRWDRPELNHSVVEFIAPREYMVRPPQPPVFVFLIDVSYHAVTTGMVATAARTILETLDRIPNQDDRTKITLIAVDTCLNFFCIGPDSTEPEMLVVSDLDDVFLPKPNDLLVNLTEKRQGIESLLGRLNDMFKDTHTVGSAMGSALQAAHKLIAPIGGKIICLTSTLPSVGPGALKNREQAKLLGTPKESTLLQAASSFYKTFPIDCSRSQVSVDMFLFSSYYTDVATLSCLPRYTGGQTYFYPAFNATRSEDALKFAHEFGEVLAQPISYEAVLRLRATRGLRASAFHGNFFVRSTDLLALPAVPLDQSYAIEVEIEETLNAPFVVFQSVVLHSTSSGERRIRVVNLALPTTTSLSEVYASADQVAIATLLANKAVERSIHSKLEDARDALMNKLVDIFSTYKSTMTSAGSGASPQLAISDNMKLLPLLVLGLLKHVGIRQSAQISPDLRAYAQALLTTLPCQLLVPYIHPTFYSLHNMAAEAGTVGEHGVILPSPLNLTSERLERHGLYLIEDGQTVFLWVGHQAVPQLIRDVFDLPDYGALRGGKATLPTLDNSFSQRVNAIIAKVRELRRGVYWPHLYIVKEDAEPSLRLWALSALIEDRFEQSPSYHQFTGMLKDKVNGSS